MSIVPVHIRPHLIPFFFKEFKGDEATYLNKKVTAIKLSNKSSIGVLMRMLMVKVEKPLRSDYFQLYLSVSDTPKGKVFEGTAYLFESGSNNFLELPSDATKVINALMEDVFRTAFIYFIDGYMKTPKAELVTAINLFIDEYELLEFGFSYETMRKIYYREKKKDEN